MKHETLHPRAKKGRGRCEPRVLGTRSNSLLRPYAVVVVLVERDISYQIRKIEGALRERPNQLTFADRRRPPGILPGLKPGTGHPEPSNPHHISACDKSDRSRVCVILRPSTRPGSLSLFQPLLSRLHSLGQSSQPRCCFWPAWVGEKKNKATSLISPSLGRSLYWGFFDSYPSTFHSFAGHPRSAITASILFVEKSAHYFEASRWRLLDPHSASYTRLPPRNPQFRWPTENR